MIDDDDVDVAAATWPAGGLFVALLGLAVIALLWYLADVNKAECAARVCKNLSSRPMVVKGECLCVERAE